MSTVSQLAAAEQRERAEAPRVYLEILKRDDAGTATPEHSEALQRCMRHLGLTFSDVSADLAALAEARRLTTTPAPDTSAALSALQAAIDEAVAEEERHREAVKAIDARRNAASNVNATASAASQNRNNRLAALRASHPRVFGTLTPPPPADPDAPVQTGGWTPRRGPSFGDQIRKYGDMPNGSVVQISSAGAR